MIKCSADLIFTNQDSPLTDGVIIYDPDSGIIKDILDSSVGVGDIKRYNGILLPGYINTHCHLELSHLKGVIPTGTGLIPFINQVITLRDYPQDEIDHHIDKADRDMWEAGIVAVGDISNKVDTVPFKRKSRLRYYTFVEMFDLLQADQASTAYQRYSEVYDQHLEDDRHRKSVVPHAPYSVSNSLWTMIQSSYQPGATISIHNQELAAENELFEHGTGDFLSFYEGLGLSLEDFQPTGKTSIHGALDYMSSEVKALFVHNTMSSRTDIAAAHSKISACYWATCPNANLYIENKLPEYRAFIDSSAKVCIGTDSLSSNWQLSIFEEMKTIKRYQSYLADEEIITWATLNGAEALGYEDLGKLQKDTSPGINHIDVDVVDEKFDLSKARSSIKIA